MLPKSIGLRDDSYMFPCAFVQLEVKTPLDALSKNKKMKPLDGMRYSLLKFFQLLSPKTVWAISVDLELKARNDIPLA